MRDTTNIVNDTLAFDEHQVMDFVREFQIPMKCDCPDGEYDLALSPDKKPSLLAIENPRDNDAENWFFWLTCLCCGQSKMISAARVWTWIKDKDQDE